MSIIDERTITELLQLVRASDDSKVLLALLQKVIEQVSDVRVKITTLPADDTLQLRQGVIKVLEDMLIKPLTISTQRKDPPEPTRYN